MQAKQIMASSERKGPHKSMHCRFCKPRGVVTPEKPIPAQLEAKTNIHLVHETADLRVRDIHDEPGFPVIENEACICVLEGENPCPKCVPDKNSPPPKKKVCTCPKGAKPHPSIYNYIVPKKKKRKEEDLEFWWEKYSREHDARAKETWAAYMAHRRREKKLEKCKKLEQEIKVSSKKGSSPRWFQKLSCQQVIYLEFLSTAIRLDADENIVERTYSVLGGIGLYPRPSKKLLKRCIRYCHYNAIQFLKQFHMLTKDVDPFNEKWTTNKSVNLYTWNESLIMNCMCHLEFPALLREIMDRLPPLPRKSILRQIPYPEFEKLPEKKYESPYEEPIWQDRLNWVEKMKIDRHNRCRTKMENKRIKPPILASVRRASLIDARPPFLAQIEANEMAARTHREEKEKHPFKKHPISTFNSAVDVTAIAEIEASEISTTDKADTEDICAFLRTPKEPESMTGEMEEEVSYFPYEKEVKFSEEPKPVETQINQIKVCSNFSDISNEEREGDEISFRTPPKSESGTTIKSPCPPPDVTPGPPALHYEKAKRELDILNQEICGFVPFVSSNSNIIEDKVCVEGDDVEYKLKSAAAKLRRFAEEQDDFDNKQPRKKIWQRGKKKEKGKRKRRIKKMERNVKHIKKLDVTELSNLTGENTVDDEKEEREENEEMQEEEEEEEEVKEEEEEEDEIDLFGKIRRTKNKRESRIASELSDFNPDTDDEWSSRPPCISETDGISKNKKMESKRKFKRSRANKRRKSRKKATEKIENNRAVKLEEKKAEYLRKRKAEKREGKETPLDSDSSNREKREFSKTDSEEKKEEKTPKKDVFRGKVEPLVKDIIRDLAEEGFNCAAFPNLIKHPDIVQLIAHLRGEIINQKLKQSLQTATKYIWDKMKSGKKFPISELNISAHTMSKLNWNYKNWISRVAKSKHDKFYYRIAKDRAQYGREFYDTLNPSYFVTDRFLKIFYAYMISKYEDAILRGIW